eukprot:4360842-Amphidinium_carterae.1
MEFLVAIVRGAGVLRVIMAVFSADMFFTFIANLSTSCYFTYLLVALRFDPEYCDSVPHVLHSSMVQLWSQEFIVLALTLAISYGLTCHTHLEVRAILNARQANASEKTIHGLLTILC